MTDRAVDLADAAVPARLATEALRFFKKGALVQTETLCLHALEPDRRTLPAYGHRRSRAALSERADRLFQTALFAAPLKRFLENPA